MSKMKFGNVALYCKGWYKHRDNNNIPIMWMDLAHCINADGWSVFSKKEVATWCMHRFDEWKDELNIDFSSLWHHIEEHRRWWDWQHDDKLSIEDAIIWTMYSLIGNTEFKKFDGKPYLPDARVLPLHYIEAYISPMEFRREGDTYQFAQMHSELMESIQKAFPDGVKQCYEVGAWVRDDSFEYVERTLSGKSYKDVLVINGSDSLLTCKKFIINGDVIINHHNVPISYEDEIGWDSELIKDSPQYLDLGIYEHCIDFDTNQVYVVYAEKTDYGYIARNIKEQQIK